MLHNVLANELLKVLRKIDGDLEIKKLSWGDIERASLLIDSIGVELFPERFIKIREQLLESSQSTESLQRRVEFLIGIVDTMLLIEFVKARADGTLELSNFFEPSSQDRLLMMGLCADLRKIVHESQWLDLRHRVRILRRIAAMELEINKEKGQLDTILSATSDIGEALGEFGSKVKPLVDRIRELTAIARKSGDEVAQIPGPQELKKLPAPNDETEAGHQ